MTKIVTILDVALARGVKADENGGISLGAFADLGLPFFCGCLRCGASMGPGQACPTKTGYTMCADCAGDHGFATVSDYEVWERRFDDEDTAATQPLIPELAEQGVNPTFLPVDDHA